MFGNLFQEDDTYLSSQQIPTPDSGGDKSGGWDAPPQPRDTCRLAGLWNQGATCYLNSLLQTLFLTPEFRGKVFFLIVHRYKFLFVDDDTLEKVKFFRNKRCFSFVLYNVEITKK